MSKLSGKALTDKARELNIPGRSKMSADELREAIYEVTRTDVPDSEWADHVAPWLGTEQAETDTTVDVEAEPKEKEEWITVPNRADKRRLRRTRNKRRPDGAFKYDQGSHGRNPKAFEESVIAGERGKFYGNRDPFKANHSADYWNESGTPGPRDVPVNIIHEGH